MALTSDALINAGYERDEYLMARVGLLAVAAAHARQSGRVTIGELHRWSVDPVDAVLSLITDGLLPDQPHLAEELQDFRAYRLLSDVEAKMPAEIVLAR